PCTSAVMNTVFPARDRPVMPSRTVGLIRPSPYSTTERAARRACSIMSERVRATVRGMWRAARDEARGAGLSSRITLRDEGETHARRPTALADRRTVQDECVAQPRREHRRE